MLQSVAALFLDQLWGCRIVYGGDTVKRGKLLQDKWDGTPYLIFLLLFFFSSFD